MSATLLHDYDIFGTTLAHFKPAPENSLGLFRRAMEGSDTGAKSLVKNDLLEPRLGFLRIAGKIASQRGERMRRISKSRTFFRKVLRLRPNNSAALI